MEGSGPGGAGGACDGFGVAGAFGRPAWCEVRLTLNLQLCVTLRNPFSHGRPPTMQKLLIVSDTPSKAAAIRQQLDGRWELQFLAFGEVVETEAAERMLFDIDLTDGSRVVELKEWLKRIRQHRKLIFTIDRDSHFQAIQAKALGANAVLHRPFDRNALFRALLRDLETLSIVNPKDPIRTAPGVGKALDALRGMFDSACIGSSLDTAAINAAGEAVMLRMEAYGLGSWLDTVRNHHSQTYQHCLIVTGVTVAFAQHLGFSRSDRLRLSVGAMLHDIGKARIPVEVLEKPSALTPDEIALLSKHPQYGFEALKETTGLQKELLDIVLHHHEYLDGSGYPDRLCGSAISDPVRIVTICDIFGALLERRAYKAPIAPKIAYKILRDMGGKLDKDLIREFAFVQTIRLGTAA
jgi:putative nucleotidyltransferase with HDIG domain